MATEADEIRMWARWEDEIPVGANVGCLRNMQALRQNWKPRAGAPLDNTWTWNIESAIGEQMVARLLGIYWYGTVGDATKPDVGPYQVRTNCSRRLEDTALRDEDLKKNSKDTVFIGVLSFCPLFKIMGWITLGEGWEKGRRGPGSEGRPDLCWVPHSLLHPMHTLPVLPPLIKLPLMIYTDGRKYEDGKLVEGVTGQRRPLVNR